MNVTSTALTHVTHGQEIAIQAVFVTFSLLYATLMLAFIVPIGHMTFMCARAAQQRLSTSSIARKYALFLMPVAAEVFLVIRVAYYLLIVSKSFSATAAGEARINGPDLGVPPAGTLLWGISNVVAVLMFFAQVILWVQIYIESKNLQRESAHKFNIISGVCSGIIFAINIVAYILYAFLPEHASALNIVTSVFIGVMVVGVDLGTLIAGVLLLSRLRPKANSVTPITHQKVLFRSFVRFSILIFGVALGFLVILVIITVWTLLYDTVTFFTFLIGSRTCSFIIEFLVLFTELIFLLLAVYEHHLQSRDQKKKINQQQQKQHHHSSSNNNNNKNNNNEKGVPTSTTTTQGSEKTNGGMSEQDTMYVRVSNEKSPTPITSSNSNSSTQIHPLATATPAEAM